MYELTKACKRCKVSYIATPISDSYHNHEKGFRKYTIKQKEAVVQYRNKGLSFSTIRKKLGLTQTEVRNIYNESRHIL